MAVKSKSSMASAVIVTAAAAKKSMEVPPPSTMPPHTSKEFDFAQRVLRSMVKDSDLFPRRAEDADWFRSRDELDDESSESGGELQPPPFLDSSISTSMGTAIDSSHSSVRTDTTRSLALDLSPPPPTRRATIEFTDTALLRLPLVRSSAPSKNRRASLDDAALLATERTELATRSTGAAARDSSSANKISIKPAETSQDLPPAEDQWYWLEDAGVEVADEEYNSPVPSVPESEVEYGQILGTGGFCEVRLACLKRRGKNKSTHPTYYAMKFLSKAKLTPEEDGDDNVKEVNFPKVRPRNKKFERAIADLVIEARFLALLSHENIINVHGVGKGSLAEQFNCAAVGGSDYHHRFGYFLLLDPLHESLARRIDGTYIPAVFENAAPASSSSRWKRLVNKKDVAPAAKNDPLLDSWRVQLVQRLEGLRGVASALEYLHDECRVVYRDVKPDNIGFYRRPHANCHCGKRAARQQPRRSTSFLPECCTCYDELPKLFDFGLCKELKPKYLAANPDGDSSDDGAYKLTARSGSRQYMCPEVALGEPYNEKADVYSFGVILYEVASLVAPFARYTPSRHEAEVLVGGDRPDTAIPSSKKAVAKARKKRSSYASWREEPDRDRRNELLTLRTKCVWTQELQRLIGGCWHGDRRSRPGMKDVVCSLDGCIRELKAAGPRQSFDVKTLAV